MKKQLLVAALAVLSISASVQALFQREGEPTVGQRLGITDPYADRGSVWGDNEGYGHRGGYYGRGSYGRGGYYGRSSYGRRNYRGDYRGRHAIDLTEPVEVDID
jgi:hypothetical protein